MDPNEIKKSATVLADMLAHTTETLAVIQGLEVGFFDRIPATKAVTVQELSGQMGYDIRMVERWLRFAVTAGHVHESANGYMLTTQGMLLRSESPMPDLLGLYYLLGYFMNVLPYSKDAYRTGVGFDSITKGAISRNFIPRVASPLAKTLVEFFTRAGLSNGHSILDLGCGDGSMLREIVKTCTGASATGIDINPHTIEFGKQETIQAGLQDQIELRIGDVTDLSEIQNNAFDWVCAINVLHFLPHNDHKKILREMARISRRGIFFNQIITNKLGACAGNILLSTLFTDFTGFFAADEADALIRDLDTKQYAFLPIMQGESRLVVILTTDNDASLSSITHLLSVREDPHAKQGPQIVPDGASAGTPVLSGPNRDRDAQTRTNMLSDDELGALSRLVDKTAQGPQKNGEALDALNKKLALQVVEKTKALTKAYERLRFSNRSLAIANREIESANKKLGVLDQIKSDFISVVSHELRTPLTSIKAYAEMILMKPKMPAETRSKLVHIIDKESDRLARLINDVLDLSRIESGKLGWRITQLSINDLIETSVSGIQSLAYNKGLTIDMQAPKSLPCIFGDRDRLIQVFNNILSNAIKFTAQGGKIVVNARAEETPKPHVVVSVSDTGIGIRSEELELIFEKFHRSGDVLESHPEGAGLGLAISRQIVEYHGGTIRVESKPGEGSTFTIILSLNKLWKQEGQEDAPKDVDLSQGPL